MMKKVEFDSNYNYLGPQLPTIPPAEVENLHLQEGEEIIAEQEGEAWKGVVKHDKNLPQAMQWYIVLGERIDEK